MMIKECVVLLAVMVVPVYLRSYSGSCWLDCGRYTYDPIIWPDDIFCNCEEPCCEDDTCCHDIFEQCGMQCPVCYGKSCHNGGTLNVNTCQCTCADGFIGDECLTMECLTTDPECVDLHNSVECQSWVERGECETNPKYMFFQCTRSCGLCPDPECVDIHDSEECQGWAESGECDANPPFMLVKCKMSCGLCPGYPEAPACKDKHDTAVCQRWAARGECVAYEPYMFANCERSCDVCPDPACVDIHDSVECQGWAARGECKANPAFMLVKCKRSCGLLCIDK